MEVTNPSNQGPLPVRRTAPDERIDITRVNREGIQDATVDISEIRAPREPYRLEGQRGTEDSEAGHEKRDSIQLSEEGRRMLAAEKQDVDAKREERVQDLTRLYREGVLNTRERIERAAAGILASS